MNVKRLRQALFMVDNQELTVRELRAILFEMNEGAEITENFDRAVCPPVTVQRRSPSDHTPLVDPVYTPPPASEPMRRPVYDPASVSLNPDGTIGRGKA